MEDNFMIAFESKKQLEVLQKTNEYTRQFGLQLTDAEISELIVERQECLIKQQRVEFGKGILENLIFAFCDFDFIFQENYAETVAALQEIFYLYKNESMDELTDDELLSYMREAFDGECQGSLEYLESTCMERFARDIRAKTHKFIGRYSDNEK
ncbi:hypothetical protein BHF70_10535 [Anaerostipes sp. 494a]|uniref:DUF6323 family protein n=1 Tax=Anaerostipes sp. 494a TaxID=1261636 RepID=UPI0009516E17|nr:DUF6323 family protein [Anaerostipes sp. 494a]OLR60013.1 hypothetical protein BHF70_10535 [Anaerostipes sp. 494a]